MMRECQLCRSCSKEDTLDVSSSLQRAVAAIADDLTALLSTDAHDPAQQQLLQTG
jgi:hypothetical protein